LYLQLAEVLLDVIEDLDARAEEDVATQAHRDHLYHIPHTSQGFTFNALEISLSCGRSRIILFAGISELNALVLWMIHERDAQMPKGVLPLTPPSQLCLPALGT
jgi:hypothetical protein